MESSAKSQEIGSKRKWENQHEHTAKHIAWHSFGYQGHYPQQRPTGDGGSLTPLLGTQKYFHVSGDGFFLTSSPYQQDVESRYLQDKKNGVITCLVCGKEGHYSCDLPMKGQEHKIICTVCSKNGHCSLWCCQQNKSESRACTRCGEIGHSTSTHGLSCSSCDEYHGDGECRLSEVKCFICESQDHYLAKCPLSSALTEAFKGQRENFQAALRLALSKQGNPSSTPATCSAESGGEVLTAKSSPICFTCREEGHFTFQCPQNSSVEFEESSTIATSSNMSKVSEERDPGTAKQSSEMKPKSVVRCVRCGEEGHRPKRCPLRYQYLVTADNTPKPKSVVRCVRCGEEGHRRKRCPFINNSMPPHMGPRPTGHFGPPAMPSPDMTTPAGFGASSTAKVSVDASLAGGIIGRGGVNTKQISRVTGAKLAIRDHESNEALKNIELEGTFDQINNASAMLRELIFRISGGANLAGGSHRAGGGPGSNFKTKLCDNFTKGSCTFGDRCHFAHGENELCKSAAA